MFWSQPKPCAKSMGWPSPRPRVEILYLSMTLTDRRLTGSGESSIGVAVGFPIVASGDRTSVAANAGDAGTGQSRGQSM